MSIDIRYYKARVNGKDYIIPGTRKPTMGETVGYLETQYGTEIRDQDVITLSDGTEEFLATHPYAQEHMPLLDHMDMVNRSETAFAYDDKGKLHKFKILNIFRCGASKFVNVREIDETETLKEGIRVFHVDDIAFDERMARALYNHMLEKKMDTLHGSITDVPSLVTFLFTHAKRIAKKDNPERMVAVEKIKELCGMEPDGSPIRKRRRNQWKEPH